MKLFYCGDIVGRSGRDVVLNNIDYIKKEYKPDVLLLNVENAAHGFGVTADICKKFLDKGADVLITGNHYLNNRDIAPFLNECKVIVRPANVPNDNPGHGHIIYELLDGRRILVIQLLGRLFMDANNHYLLPTIDDILKNYNLSKNVEAIFVDIHAEATSEKLSLGYYLDGRVSCVAGTHTHVPTADARILPNGTAYITDVGMCGDYNSVLGFDKETPINRLRQDVTMSRLTPALGKGTIYAIFVETDDKTGLAKQIRQVKIQ